MLSYGKNPKSLSQTGLEMVLGHDGRADGQTDMITIPNMCYS